MVWLHMLEVYLKVRARKLRILLNTGCGSRSKVCLIEIARVLLCAKRLSLSRFFLCQEKGLIHIKEFRFHFLCYGLLVNVLSHPLLECGILSIQGLREFLLAAVKVSSVDVWITLSKDLLEKLSPLDEISFSQSVIEEADLVYSYFGLLMDLVGW